MKTAVDAKTGITINADGTPAVGNKDYPFLHLLPKLWLPYEGLDVKKESSVWLESITIPELDYDSGDTNFTPSRPYPNWNYVVFGAEGTKMGLYLSLPENPPESLSIKTLYCLRGPFRARHAAHYLEVRQEQHLILERGDIGTACYSTEHCTPVFISEKDYVQVFKDKHADRITLYGHPQDDECLYCDYWDIATQDTVKPLTNRYVFSSEFEHFIPHRDREQCIQLTKDNEAHRNNAVVEAPFALLQEAVALAKEGIDHDQLPEDNPALRHLCQWWNTHPKVPEAYRQAKVCDIYVRANDDDGYQNIDTQVPNFPVTDYTDTECSTRIGDHFLIVFLLGKEACTEKHQGTTAYMVNGESHVWVGLTLDDFILGYETLDNLRDLDEHYSTLFKHYANHD